MATQTQKKQREIFQDFPLNYEVEIAKKSLLQAKEALLFGEIRCIVGDSGVGKSNAIKVIQSHYPKNTYVVKCRKGMRKNRFMMEVLRQFGVNNRMTYDDAVDELKDRLRAGHLLIVDEPEHITIEAIEGVRYLNDETGCAVLFIGLPEFISYIKSHRRQYEYVYNRINMNLHAKNMNVKDYEKLLNSVDIDIRYAPLLHELTSVNNGKERVAVTRFLRSILRSVVLECIEHNHDMEDEKTMIRLFKSASKKLEVNIK